MYPIIIAKITTINTMAAKRSLTSLAKECVLGANISTNLSIAELKISKANIKAIINNNPIHIILSNPLYKANNITNNDISK